MQSVNKTKNDNFRSDIYCQNISSTGIFKTVDSVRLSGNNIKKDKEKDLTVLFYMNGEYKDIGKMISNSLFPIENSGSNKDVNIVAQVSDVPETADNGNIIYDVKRYEITAEQNDINNTDKLRSSIIAQLNPEKSIARKEVLQDFIQWGIKNFPSKHYMLVFMGHGGAWKGALDIKSSDICDALITGINNSNKETGRNDSIDVEIFNSCLMGNLENLFELKDTSKYTLASEDIAMANAFGTWGDILKKVKNDIKETGGFDPEKFSIDLIEYYKNRQAEENIFRTFALYDNSKIEKITDTLEEFIDILNSENISVSVFLETVEKSYNFRDTEKEFAGDYNYKTNLRDLSSICQNVLKENWCNEKIRTKIKNILQAIDDAIIIQERNGEYSDDKQSGISINCPVNAGIIECDMDEYILSAENFVKKTKWENILITEKEKTPYDLRNEFKQLEGSKLSLVYKKRLRLQKSISFSTKLIGTFEDKKNDIGKMLLNETDPVKINELKNKIMMISKHQLLEKNRIMTAEKEILLLEDYINTRASKLEEIFPKLDMTSKKQPTGSFN